MKVSGGHKLTRIVAGSESAFGLDASGIWWAWGKNSDEQLGDGTNENRMAPAKASSGCKFTQVSAGGSSSATINKKGRTYIWGSYYTCTCNGSEGGYGVATVEYPVDAYGRPHTARICVKDIAPPLVLDFDGRARGWDSDYPGKIYHNYLIDHVDPVKVSGGHEFTQIVASDGSAFGLDASGIWQAWGANNFGRLGDDSKENRLTPVPVGLGKIRAKMNPEQFRLKRPAGFSQVVFNKQDLLVPDSEIVQVEKTFKNSGAPLNLAAGDKAVSGVVKGVDATGDKLVGGRHSFETYVVRTYGVSVSVGGPLGDSVNVDALKATVSVDMCGYRNLQLKSSQLDIHHYGGYPFCSPETVDQWKTRRLRTKRHDQMGYAGHSALS